VGVAPRILIKGTSGAGKTTVASRLAAALGIPHIELDALHHGPGWSEPPVEVFRARVGAALDDARGWIVDGNYDRKLGAMLLDRASAIVWLDLPLAIKLARLWSRTWRRVRRRELLWNGNQDSWRGAFWGRESLFAWMLRAHVRHRREWPALFARRPAVRLRSDREVEAWIAITSRA
jgi:adenylate kinase family enzyme